MIDGDDELFCRQAELARGGIENAHVGLMGDHPVDVLDRHVRGGQRLARRLLQHLDRKIEHTLTGHLQERRADHPALAACARPRHHPALPAVAAGGAARGRAALQREIAGALTWVGDVALNDSRAPPDPRVARIQARGKFAVRHYARRQVAAGAHDARIDHAAGTCNCPMRAAIRWGTLLRTSSTARSSAWPKANTSAEPWLLMTMPRSPSRLAPL